MMGTRAQVLVNGVYLYQNSDGDNLFKKVCLSVNRAIAAWRDNDPEYLARIIFCDMIQGDERGTAGFGIGSEPFDDINFLVVVDIDEKTIKQYHNNDQTGDCKISINWGHESLVNEMRNHEN
jgi:hypothetical protein